MHSLFQDLRFGLRTMRRTPGVTLVALASLALGLGANVTIFSLVNAIFLRPLPVADLERLVAVVGTDVKQKALGNALPISRLNFEDYRDRNTHFDNLVNVSFAGVSLSRSGGEPERMGALLVSGDYFEMLGLKPARGRFFLPEEDQAPGRNPVAVLSWRQWHDKLGADEHLVGSVINLNGHPFTVVGVAPEGFVGTFVLGTSDVWVPTMSYPEVLPTDLVKNFRERRPLLTFILGRMKSGVTLEQAQAELQAIGKQLEQEHPEENTGRNVALMPLAQSTLPPQLRGLFTQAGGMLMVVVGLVLLIACANVANLLLGRAVARRGEIAVRLSIGAGRGRLVRQLLVESLLLGLVAAGLGLALAYLGRSALWAMRPPFLQGTVLDLSFDGRVLGFTLVLAVVTSVLFGLLPALQTTRAGVVSELKDGGGVSGERFRFLSRRNLLVAGQVALALVALSGASLLMASLRRAMAIDPGFNVQQTGVMAFDVGALGLDRGRGEQFYDAVLERARATPGVTSAALVTDIPLTFGGFLRTVFAEGHDPKAENNGLLTAVDPIGDGYFKTIGIELLRGRDFSSLDREDGAYVAIFNETAAKRFWPGEEALGKRFRFFGEKWILEVVGIAKDSKYNNVGEDPVPHIYLPRWQHYGPALGLVLRCQGKPEVALATVRNEVRKLEPNMPVANVQPMAAVVRQSLWAPRMGAWLLGILGGMAMVLALVGIYGVMSYSVEQRKREIGIRMALGAGVDSVIQLILRQGLLAVAVGVAVGLALALAGSRAIAGMVFGSSTDPLPFVLTTLVLAGVAAVAAFLPARRAAEVDPVRVLKGA